MKAIKRCAVPGCTNLTTYRICAMHHDKLPARMRTRIAMGGDLDRALAFLAGQK